jgi:transposase
MGRPNSTLVVTAEDKAALEAMLRAGKTRQSMALRARIILLSGAGKTVAEVRAETGAGTRTVYEWRRRYQQMGIAGLKDKPRPGQPRKLTPEQAKRILKLTTEGIPQEATHWSERLMAKYAKVTPHHVRQVWKAADLKPHRLKSFKISNDPEFAEKVIDVVGLYLNPPDNAMVLSVDEKTQIQALDRTQPMLPLRPGQVERRTHDYKRNGTRSLYAAFDVATGKVIGRVTQRHRAREYLDFLKQIERAVPEDLELHLIADNSSTHKTEEVLAWLGARPRIHVHYTPTSSSWLNAVEGWFGQLERRSLQRGVFTNVTALRDEIHRYIEVHNAYQAKPFRWTKSAAAILDSVDRAKAAKKVRY